MSLKHQWFMLQQQLNCVGDSKHEAKQVNKQFCNNNNTKWNPLKTMGIYSESTYDNYMDVGNSFIGWLKETHPEIKELQDLTKSIAIEYIQDRIDDGLRSSTIDKDQAAFNKVFITYDDFHISMDDLRDVGYIKDTDIIKGRYEHEFDAKYDLHVLLAEATSARRSSLCEVTNKQHHHLQYIICPESIYRCNDKLYCSLVEKGGLYRNTEVLGSKMTEIEQLYSIKNIEIAERNTLRCKEEYEQQYKNFSQPFLEKDSLPTTEPIHQKRAEYAKAFYHQLEQEKIDRGQKIEKNCYKEFDKELVQEVSNNLGHGRLDICVMHYLR